jgi:hypothetical protein
MAMNGYDVKSSALSLSSAVEGWCRYPVDSQHCRLSHMHWVGFWCALHLNLCAILILPSQEYWSNAVILSIQNNGRSRKWWSSGRSAARPRPYLSVISSFKVWPSARRRPFSSLSWSIPLRVVQSLWLIWRSLYVMSAAQHSGDFREHFLLR